MHTRQKKTLIELRLNDCYRALEFAPPCNYMHIGINGFGTGTVHRKHIIVLILQLSACVACASRMEGHR